MSQKAVSTHPETRKEARERDRKGGESEKRGRKQEGGLRD